MKKVINLFLISLFLFPMITLAESDITPNAKSAVMIDYSTGEVLYDKNGNEKRSVASLTKMMGLILIFEKIDNGSLKKDEILTTSKNAKEMGGTQIWLEEGEKISVDDLIKGITMASANDAMVLMAERVSGTEEEFVKEMNKKAKKLGLKNTHFVNCTGFDEEGNYSSAYDMTIIAKELIKHDKILDYTSKYESYIREGTDNKTWIVNTNKLTKFYKGVDGLKTGFTDNAGSSLAVTAKKDNLRLIAITLGYPNTNIRNKEAMALLDYGYKKYSSKLILKKGELVRTIDLNKGLSKAKLYLKDDVIVLSKKGEETSDYSYKIKLSNISYPIKKGSKMGTLILKNKNKIISETDLIVGKDIKKPNIFKQYLSVVRDIFSGSVY